MQFGWPLSSKPFRGAIVDRSSRLASGLVAAWAMNEGGGPSLSDSAGRASATFAAGTAAPTWATAPSVGTALVLNGSQYATVTNPPEMGNTVTVLAIASLDTVTNYGMILSAGGYAFELRQLGATGQIQFLFNSTGAVATTPTTYGDTKIHVFAGTYDGTTGYIYVDGTSKASTSSAGSLTYSSTWAIGTRPGANNFYWLGHIGAVFVWNRALSGAEIAEAGASPNAIWPLLYPPGPLRSWPFLQSTATASPWPPLIVRLSRRQLARAAGRLASTPIVSVVPLPRPLVGRPPAARSARWPAEARTRVVPVSSASELPAALVVRVLPGRGRPTIAQVLAALRVPGVSPVPPALFTDPYSAVLVSGGDPLAVDPDYAVQVD